jgi:hypothetical protein
MTKPIVPRLRCTGMVPRAGFREYGFSIEEKDKAMRKVVLTIDDGVFRDSQLMLQEAPDLCYQKLLADLDAETADSAIRSRRSIGPSDIAQYRDAHPSAKARGRFKRSDSGHSLG